MSDTLQKQDVMIGIQEVSVLTGMSRTTIYRLRKKNRFPKPHEYSWNMLRWPRNEVLEWIESHKPKNN